MLANRTRTAALAALMTVMCTVASAQDWRTSNEDPCACRDSMPYIIGPRPAVGTPAEIAAMVRDSADPSCRVSRLAVETLRDAQDPTAPKALLTALTSPACAIRASAAYSQTHGKPPRKR